MTDIWRSFVAQRVIHQGHGILFHGRTVWQERNEHDLHRDFIDELPGYPQRTDARGTHGTVTRRRTIRFDDDGGLLSDSHPPRLGGPGRGNPAAVLVRRPPRPWRRFDMNMPNTMNPAQRPMTARPSHDLILWRSCSHSCPAVLSRNTPGCQGGRLCGGSSRRFAHQIRCSRRPVVAHTFGRLTVLVMAGLVV